MRVRNSRYYLIALAAVFALGPASAAEMPVKAPALFSPVPVSHWTGFYAGVHLGGAWGYFRNDGLNAGPDESSGSVIGGAQLGYNWQSGRLVFGLEGDFSAFDIHADTPAVGSFNERWTSSLRGRLGYAVENYLAYLTGGVAFTHVETALTGGGSGSATIAGPAFGFGIETMFAPHWTGRVEALYMGVPLHTFNILGGPVVGGSHNYTVRAGVNYLFN
jgi:outer membrane immunogenic protein